jgi:hypothetical protein
MTIYIISTDLLNRINLTDIAIVSSDVRSGVRRAIGATIAKREFI